MTQFWQRILDWCWGVLPRALPIGAKAFDDYCTRVFRVWGFPDNPSYRNAIAKMILHFGPQTWRKAPYFFAISLRAGQAREVAWNFTEDARAEAKRQADEAKAAAQPKGEVTPTPESTLAAETKAP